jgi:hypothetical protein
VERAPQDILLNCSGSDESCVLQNDKKISKIVAFAIGELELITIMAIANQVIDNNFFHSFKTSGITYQYRTVVRHKRTVIAS